MLRLFRWLIYLVVIGGLGLAGYAFVGDLSPERSEIRRPVVLDGR